MASRAAHGGSEQLVGLEEPRPGSLPTPRVLELVAEHRAERAVRDPGKVAPKGETVRVELGAGDPLGSDGPEYRNYLGADDTRRMQVGEGRRARRTRRRDDIGDDRRRGDARVAARCDQLLAKAFGIEHGASVTYGGYPPEADILGALSKLARIAVPLGLAAVIFAALAPVPARGRRRLISAPARCSPARSR